MKVGKLHWTTVEFLVHLSTTGSPQNVESQINTFKKYLIQHVHVRIITVIVNTRRNDHMLQSLMERQTDTENNLDDVEETCRQDSST